MCVYMCVCVRTHVCVCVSDDRILPCACACVRVSVLVCTRLRMRAYVCMPLTCARVFPHGDTLVNASSFKMSPLQLRHLSQTICVNAHVFVCVLTYRAV